MDRVHHNIPVLRPGHGREENRITLGPGEDYMPAYELTMKVCRERGLEDREFCWIPGGPKSGPSGAGVQAGTASTTIAGGRRQNPSVSRHPKARYRLTA